eukprot:354765-Chlamydomonas_euryale.AAC.2
MSRVSSTQPRVCVRACTSAAPLRRSPAQQEWGFRTSVSAFSCRKHRPATAGALQGVSKCNRWTASVQALSPSALRGWQLRIMICATTKRLNQPAEHPGPDHDEQAILHLTFYSWPVQDPRAGLSPTAS